MTARPAVEEFVDLAERYCRKLERIDATNPRQLLDDLLALLPRLYAAAWRLPEVEPPTDEPIAVSPEAASREKEIATRIGQLLGEANLYQFMFDPFDDEAPVSGHIGADLSEVYGDLRSALSVFRRGRDEDVLNATWEWRFSFLTHWGRHALVSLVALHALATDRGLPTKDGPYLAV